jgi:hypothetical protein
MAKRFGQLSKKKKKKIRAKAANKGLTKKQVRDKYNARQERKSNKKQLTSNYFSTPVKDQPFVGPIQEPTPPAPTPSGELTNSLFNNVKDVPFQGPVKSSAPTPTPIPTPAPTPAPTLEPFDPSLEPLEPVEPFDLEALLTPLLEATEPTFFKNNATYLSGSSAGGIRRRRSKRSSMGINSLGTNQLQRNLKNRLSIGGINI